MTASFKKTHPEFHFHVFITELLFPGVEHMDHTRLIIYI